MTKFQRLDAKNQATVVMLGKIADEDFRARKEEEIRKGEEEYKHAKTSKQRTEGYRKLVTSLSIDWYYLRNFLNNTSSSRHSELTDYYNMDDEEYEAYRSFAFDWINNLCEKVNTYRQFSWIFSQEID